MPRKSTASTSNAPTSPTTTTAPAGDTSTLSHTTEPKSPTTSKAKKQQDDNIGVDDLLLPRSLTSRIARGILPANTSIQKDAVLALTKSATVFISYLASNANELTSKKTITPQDVLNAVKEIEMEGIMELGKVGEDGRRGGRLERELEMFEESVRGKRKGYREKVKARESGVSEIEGGGERGEPETKRIKRSDEDEGDVDEELLDAQLNGPDALGLLDQDVGAGAGLPLRADGAEDHDETEDDPEIEDELEDGDDGEDVPDDDEEHEDEQRDGDDDRIDTDDGEVRNRTVLVPNGRAEVGSDDDSD